MTAARHIAVVMFLAGFLAPTASQAQLRTELPEVERGISVTADVGFFGLLVDPARGSGVGMTVGVDLGYDINDWITVQLGYAHLYADGVRSADIRDPSDPATGLVLGQNGDKSPLQRIDVPADTSSHLVSAGARLRFPIAALHPRLNAVVDAGLGAVLTSPDDVRSGFQLALNAGGGLEYDTSLRHFAVGIRAITHTMFLGDLAMGLHISPTLRYTF